MAIKISDIAKIAGVSKASVSLALNEKPGISDQTRTKIIKIAKEHGYQPLRKKRADITSNLGTVTFLVVTTSGVVKSNYRTLPFFNSLISCLSAEVGALNGSLKTITINQEELGQRIGELKTTATSFLVLGTDRDQLLSARNRPQSRKYWTIKEASQTRGFSRHLLRRYRCWFCNDG